MNASAAPPGRYARIAWIVTWTAALVPLMLPAVGQDLGLARRMLRQDNPGELWVQRGAELFVQPRGPKHQSLQGCDFGLGPGVLKGAFAQLPRFFPDTRQVQDLESRLVSCMVTLQGHDRAELVRKAFSTPERASDLEALAAFVASQSNGERMNPPLSTREERAMLAAGEMLFYRRSGPLDFACASCHRQDGKRVRLQELANFRDAAQAQAVVAGWPAYRGTQGTLRTLQHRIIDCAWQMRLPDVPYISDMTIALTSYLNHQGRGAVVDVPGVVR